MKHYYRDPWMTNQKVNLVGHSMGGVIIAGYVRQFGAAKKVGKVATLAAPFRGSYEAVIKIITGTANLGATPPSSHERESARLTPALYQLFPRFPGALRREDDVADLSFEPGNWQPSILQTLQEYIRLHAVSPPANVAHRALEIFTDLLNGGASTARVSMRSISPRRVSCPGTGCALSA